MQSEIGKMDGRKPWSAPRLQRLSTRLAEGSGGNRGESRGARRLKSCNGNKCS